MAGVADKTYISADRERADCWKMAAEICRKEIPFDLVIGLTRGGGPIGFYLQEFFCAYWKKSVGYANLRTRSYSGIGEAGGVEVGSLEEVIKELGEGKRLLIADDIFDRGKTVEEVLKVLRARLPGTEAKVATLYYKPENSEVAIKPDYYAEVFAGDNWVVFPRSVTEADGVEGRIQLGMSREIAAMFPE